MKNDLLKKTLIALYMIGFLFAFGSALPSYISSTFLSSFVPEKTVGIIYTIGSILSIITIIFIQPILKKIGNYKLTSLLFILNSLTFLILAFSNSATLIILAFIINFAIPMILLFNLDIFLEKYSSTRKTGGIRGLFLTTINTAWVISPLITGLILTDGDYWKIFTISSLLSILTIPILRSYFKNFEDSHCADHYGKINIWNTFKQIQKNKNIYKIFMSNTLLGFFYALMVIYTPIYLHQHIGFEWSAIGIIFTIMLLPFIIFEYPLGWIADKKYGEKEMLSIGFIVIALSSGAISFITTNSLLTWSIILFTTRVGASIIEIMNETYFFKKVNEHDVNIIGFFRISKPIAYIIAPIFATIFLSFFDLKYIFVVLSIIMLYGLNYSLTIKDTK